MLRGADEMTELTVTTYDWVPELPRGYVRDLRVCWALEEAGLSYRIATTPFHDRSADHFARHPFGQVPWLTDGDITIFESGAILLHLAEGNPALMPTDPAGRANVIQWLFAALNSVEMASVPWSILKFAGASNDSPGMIQWNAFLTSRLGHMEAVLAGRDWLGGAFSIADIAMADVLRLVGRLDGLTTYPACSDYVDRATSRPAFIKAHADQMTHFAAADPA